MLGLAVLFFIALYFFCLIFFTRLAHKLALSIGASKKVASLCRLLVFSAIFLPVFWDTIPNYVAYNYYCKNEAGFFQYKTIEQWKAENLGVWETLKPYSRDEVDAMRKKKIEPPNMMYEGDWYYSIPVNSRITVYSIKGNIRGYKGMGFGIRKSVKFLYDEQKKEVIAKYVGFMSGPGNVLELGGGDKKGYKIWLNQEPCSGSGYFHEVWDQFINDSLKQKGKYYG